jgi:hypothetical protein
LIRIDAWRFVESAELIFFYQWPELFVGADSGGTAMLQIADLRKSLRTSGGVMANSAMRVNCAPPL